VMAEPIIPEQITVMIAIVFTPFIHYFVFRITIDNDNF